MPTDQEVELLARWNATLPRQQELGENLITRYSEPHRRYHGTKHLLHVMIMTSFWYSWLPGFTTPSTPFLPARSATRRLRQDWRCGS